MLRQSSSTTDHELEGYGSSPCLNISMQAEQHSIDVKMFSPDSKRRLFSRKPGAVKPLENQRSRKLAEETRELAGFYSPTSHHLRNTNDGDSSVTHEGSFTTLTHRTAIPRPIEEHNLSSTSIRFCEERPAGSNTPKPRVSARILNPQQLIVPAANTTAVTTKTEETAAKKIRILEIQLEAVNLQNGRLKHHINMLRNNQQESRRVAVTEVGSISGALLQFSSNCHEQRKSPEGSSEHWKKQNMSDETERLRRACSQLNSELASAREELEQERTKLASELSALQESEKRLKDQLVQLESILAINRREHSMLKSTNQQLTVRVWNLNRQLAQIQAAEKERNFETKNLLRKQRIAICSSRLRTRQQFDEHEDELFELSPDREQ